MRPINFYSIEYVINGEIDIKHAFMNAIQLHELCDKFNSKKIKYTIYLLSNSGHDIKLLNE